jgi:hypothetical protein
LFSGKTQGNKPPYFIEAMFNMAQKPYSFVLEYKAIDRRLLLICVDIENKCQLISAFVP